MQTNPPIGAEHAHPSTATAGHDSEVLALTEQEARLIRNLRNLRCFQLDRHEDRRIEDLQLEGVAAVVAEMLDGYSVNFIEQVLDQTRLWVTDCTRFSTQSAWFQLDIEELMSRINRYTGVLAGEKK